MTVPMGAVAPGITADGYMIGAASADAAVQGDDTADTGDWEPGDTGTALAVLGGLGLGALLAGGEGDGGGGPADGVAGDMEDGYLSVTAGVLAGWDPDVAAGELASMLEDAVADSAYAEALTATQILVLSGQAAYDYYLASSVSKFQWVIDDSPNVCPVCLANERQGPLPAGTPFQGGVTQAPQHPRCRCAVLPAWFLSGG